MQHNLRLMSSFIFLQWWHALFTVSSNNAGKERILYIWSATHTHTCNAIHTCTCEMYSISLLLLKIDSESDSEEDETQDDDPFSPETEKFPNNSQHPFDPANLPLSAGNEVLRVVTFHTLLAPPPLPPRPQKTRIDPSQHYEVKGRRERGFILSLPLSLSLSLSSLDEHFTRI